MARRTGRKANEFMPGLRVREDGWTAARTRKFLAVLAQTGCVSDAARLAGISRKSVNDARQRFPKFDHACAEALAQALRGLEAVAYQRAVEGRETLIIRDGKVVERRVTPSDAMLALLIKRGDLNGASGRGMSDKEAEAYVLPEAVRHRFISREEFKAGMVFANGQKQKRHIATQEETDAVLLKRIAMVKRNRARRHLDNGRCGYCGHPLGPREREVLDAVAAGLPPPLGWDAPVLPPPD